MLHMFDCSFAVNCFKSSMYCVQHFKHFSPAVKRELTSKSKQNKT